MFFRNSLSENLDNFFKDLRPNLKYEMIDFTIGEPKFNVPKVVTNELEENSYLLRKYANTKGDPILKKSILNFIKRRFDIKLREDEIVLTLGTRELLFNFPQFFLFFKNNPVMAFTNPFYYVYEGAAKLSRAKIIYLDLKEENSFKPPIVEEDLKKCNLVVLNFPNNPTGTVLSLEELAEWVHLSMEYDFLLLNDECYSEIYIDNKPPSLLQAAKLAKNSEYKNILVANSISKRSSAPGLRSGFIAGDRKILKDYLSYRQFCGCNIPIPLQRASAVAWEDEYYPDLYRKRYIKNFKIFEDILGVTPPKGTFYIWLNVYDDLDFSKKLFTNYSLKVTPGSFLGEGECSRNYVRIPLTYEEDKIMSLANRLKAFSKRALSN